MISKTIIIVYASNLINSDDINVNINLRWIYSVKTNMIEYYIHKIKNSILQLKTNILFI